MIKKITLNGLFIGKVTNTANKTTFPLWNVLMEWKLDKDGLMLDGTNWVVINIGGLNDSSFTYSKNGGVLNGIRRTVMKEFSIQMYKEVFDAHEYCELPCDNSIKYNLEFTTDDGFYVIDDVYPRKIERTNERFLTLTFIIGKIMKKSGTVVSLTKTRLTTYQSMHCNIGYYETGHQYTIPRTLEEVARAKGYPPEVIYLDEEQNAYYTDYKKIPRHQYSIEYIMGNWTKTRDEIIEHGNHYYFLEANPQTTWVGNATITADTQHIPYDVLTIGWNTSDSGYSHTTTEQVVLSSEHDGIFPEDIESLDTELVQQVLQKNTHKFNSTDTTAMTMNNHALNVVAIYHNVNNELRYSNAFRHDCSGFTYVFKYGASGTSVPLKYSLWKEVYEIV